MKIPDIAGLKKSFLAYQAGLQELRGQLDSVQLRIKELERDRRHLHLHQASRDEFIAAMQAEVDRVAEEGQRRRREMLHAWRRPPGPNGRGVGFDASALTWPAALDVSRGQANFGSVSEAFIAASTSVFGSTLGAGSPGAASLDVAGLCAMMGGAIKDEIRSFLESEPWPECPPSSERLAQVEAIDTELAELRAQESKLQKLIQENSLT
jgi:hypothetical protein